MDASIPSPLAPAWERGCARGPLDDSCSLRLWKDQGASGLDRVAGAGASGQHAGNLFRDLKSIFGWPAGCAPIDWITIPTKHSSATPHPVLWPHKFFQVMWTERKDFFEERLVGPAGACDHFWQGIKDSKFVVSHPCLPPEVWPSTVPLGFHADGGGFNKHDSLFGLSWNSLVTASTASVQSRFLFTGIRKSEMLVETLDVLMKAFAWSVNVLLSGQTPFTDWQNRPLEGGGRELCGGWRGQVAQVRGDWQFYCQAFYFAQWNTADVMCPFCRASNVVEARAWYHVGEHAAWRDTLWSHESYMAHLRSNNLPVPVFFMVGCGIIGLRLECVMVDILHTLDLGLLANVIGSVMFVLACIRKKLGGNTYEQAASRLSDHMTAWYKRVHCRCRIKGTLTLARLRGNKGWAKLKAHGAATRHLIGYALDLIAEFGDARDPLWGEHDRLATAVCQLLNRFYVIIGSESSRLSDGTKAELQLLGNQVVVCYAKLARFSHDRHYRIWKMAPKLHLFEHLILQSCEFGNPAYWWTYLDEDLVGRLIRIAHTVHPTTIAVSMLCKWVHCVFSEMVLDLDTDTYT